MTINEITRRAVQALEAQQYAANPVSDMAVLELLLEVAPYSAQIEALLEDMRNGGYTNWMYQGGWQGGAWRYVRAEQFNAVDRGIHAALARVARHFEPSDEAHKWHLERNRVSILEQEDSRLIRGAIAECGISLLSYA